MRGTFGAACLSALIGAWPMPSVCAEYQDSDVLPVIGYVVFTKDAVGFVSRPNPHFGGRNPVFRFAYDRGSRKLAEVDERQFQARFPAIVPKENPRETSGEHVLIGEAGNGVEYRSKLKYCGEGDENKRGLAVGGKPVRILAREECTSVSSLDIVDGQLWLGTVELGEGGYTKAEGIIVESPGGARVLARIPLPGWVIQVRADPFSSTVWAVTDTGIYEIIRQFRIVEAHLYYHDFDPASGEPRFSFSGTAMPGNPFSAVSRMLPVEERKGFYEAVRKIPEADLREFKLYDFFMCCGFDKSYPATFRPLVPFFVKQSVQEKPGFRDVWRQAACGAGGAGADVAKYCERSE